MRRAVEDVFVCARNQGCALQMKSIVSLCKRLMGCASQSTISQASSGIDLPHSPAWGGGRLGAAPALPQSFALLPRVFFG